MRKPTFYLLLLMTGFLFLSTSASAGLLPPETPVQRGQQAAINVPPPVLRAFGTMLLSVAKDYGFTVAEIRSFSTSWKKEKNEYSVIARFAIAGCDDGATFNELVATFKANGTVVPIMGLNGKMSDYVFYFTNCIRAPF